MFFFAAHPDPASPLAQAEMAFNSKRKVTGSAASHTNAAAYKPPSGGNAVVATAAGSAISGFDPREMSIRGTSELVRSGQAADPGEFDCTRYNLSL